MSRHLFTMTPSIAAYYSAQAGGGLHHIGPLYKSPRKYQQGYGIGSFLGNVLSYLRPIAMKGLKQIGEQTYKTSSNVLSDLIENKPLGDIVQSRAKEAILGLTEKGIDRGIKVIKRKMGKQSGRGINKRARRRKNSLATRRRKKIKQIGGRRVKRKRTKRRSKKRVLDIFT